MPTLRMRTDSAGPKGNRYAGKEYPVSAEEGWDLVRGGFAEWVDPPARDARPVEVAAVQPTRTAARPKPKARSR